MGASLAAPIDPSSSFGVCFERAERHLRFRRHRSPVWLPSRWLAPIEFMSGPSQLPLVVNYYDSWRLVNLRPAATHSAAPIVFGARAPDGLYMVQSRLWSSRISSHESAEPSSMSAESSWLHEAAALSALSSLFEGLRSGKENPCPVSSSMSSTGDISFRQTDEHGQGAGPLKESTMRPEESRQKISIGFGEA